MRSWDPHSNSQLCAQLWISQIFHQWVFRPWRMIHVVAVLNYCQPDDRNMVDEFIWSGAGRWQEAKRQRGIYRRLEMERKGRTDIVKHDIDEEAGHDSRISICQNGSQLLLLLVWELAGTGVEFEDRHVDLKVVVPKYKLVELLDDRVVQSFW